MATATVSFNGLDSVSLVYGLETILEFDKNGIRHAQYSNGQEIPLKNGHAFVLDKKVQFLLDDGMKFEVRKYENSPGKVQNSSGKNPGKIRKKKKLETL